MVRLALVAFMVGLAAMMAACGSRAGGGAATPIVAPAPAAPALPPPAPEPSAPAVIAPRPVASAIDECAVNARPLTDRPDSPSGDIVTVGLADRVDVRHAPRPTNEGERLLFRQLYETLVQVDCLGRAIPGLAASWRLDSDGRTWLVTLRDDAAFADGTVVGPRDVRASWTSDGVGDALRPEVARLVESVTETDDRTLAVRLRHPRAAPLGLAHPDLAIAKPGVDSAWPLGTRAGVVADAGAASTITIRRANQDVLRFLVAPGDPRDLLDRGVDLMVTRNPTALNYAATLPSFQSTPLDWQRTYVLLAPGRSGGLPLLSDGQREVLADDAVRGEARGARGPFWWQMQSDCGAPDAAPAIGGPRTQPPAPRVVYDASDDVARDLAERFVGLARVTGPGAIPFLDVLLPDRPRRTYQRAAALDGDAFALARRIGADAGYVMAVDSHPLEPCHERERMTRDAGWLDPETIVPLVETRAYAIVRRGRHGIRAEWNGGVLIVPAGVANGAK